MDTPFVVIAPADITGSPALVCAVDMDTTMSVIHLIGELDIATAPLVTSVVDGQVDQGHAHLHLDLTELEFCDLRGLAALIDAERRLQAAGGRLVLHHPSDLLESLVAWCGVEHLLDAAA